MKDKKDNSVSSEMVIGMCLGLCIGTAIGAATDNIGLWMPIGLSVGMCPGIALENSETQTRRMITWMKTMRKIAAMTAMMKNNVTANALFP